MTLVEATDGDGKFTCTQPLASRYIAGKETGNSDKGDPGLGTLAKYLDENLRTTRPHYRTSTINLASIKKMSTGG